MRFLGQESLNGSCGKGIEKRRSGAIVRSVRLRWGSHRQGLGVGVGVGIVKMGGDKEK